jgi:hypothetical protein
MEQRLHLRWQAGVASDADIERGASVSGRRLASVLLTAVALVTAACGGDGASIDTAVSTTTSSAAPPTTTATTTTTLPPTTLPGAPAVTDDLVVQLEVRTIQRVLEAECAYLGYCRPDPICVDHDSSPELVAAIETAFPQGTLAVDFAAYGTDCNPLAPGSDIEQPRPDVVGVGIWSGTVRHRYWFRWDGHQWIDITPEQAGTTDTTWVS